MEVTQVWEYGQFVDEILYAPFIGDVDFLSETVLITHGGIAKGENGFFSDSDLTPYNRSTV